MPDWPHPAPATSEAAPSRFPRTRWTLVRRATDVSGEEQLAALNELCGAYWNPLYSWARFRGLSSEDARDGVQGFFAYLLGTEGIVKANEARGKFRNFLLTSFRNFLENQRIHHAAQKRGGGVVHVSYDQSHADSFHESCDFGVRATDSGQEFDRRWAASILKRAEEQVKQEYHARNRADIFEALQPFLTDSPSEPQLVAISAEAGMKPESMRVALHRQRKRFGNRVVELVRETVDTEEDLREEMETLYRALRDA